MDTKLNREFHLKPNLLFHILSFEYSNKLGLEVFLPYRTRSSILSTPFLISYQNHKCQIVLQTTNKVFA